MMREILFRGKREKTSEWVEGLLSYSPYGEPEMIEVFSKKTKGIYYEPVDPETVGQYTGLDDCTGKRIFEGDIVYLSGVGSVEMEYPFIDLFNACAECDIGEICGNVHDNPELLEGDARE